MDGLLQSPLGDDVPDAHSGLRILFHLFISQSKKREGQRHYVQTKSAAQEGV